MSDSKEPSRIGFKLGGASSRSPKPANGAKPPRQPQSSSSLGKRPRSHAFEPDSDSGEDEFTGRHEAVTEFGTNGAENEGRRREAKASRTSETPVIACQTSQWDNVMKSRRPRNEVKSLSLKETDVADADKDIEWGLNVADKSVSKQPPAAADRKTEADNRLAEDNNSDDETDDNMEKNAMNALLGKDKRKKQKLVITEDDALKRGVQTAGEISTTDEYDQIPDGEFGAAMLRGMGWDGKPVVTKRKEVKRRQNLLGLGAKEDEEIKKLELAKKHGHRERRPRLDEYRKDEELRRQRREEKHSNSYRNERERERRSRRHDERDRDHPRGSDRHRDRDSTLSRPNTQQRLINTEVTPKSRATHP
ncbi:DExH-box splicing factor binding site-domain-containing protein [Pseudomassariella vexata]|uniref:Pre-mRNA-splicing factor n=1 Tax=Pseudomassariella vexata TaxID=1141098 RepID=A0A1Y2EEF7_9PEZI|nr:DExH-box splicing factor binding site-domain-containing protein [Pseudomassariella vexata]ORY69951.1 DExH-box splicing factor binding site-domain-containing protein [Pseudomassariella vexata]